MFFIFLNCQVLSWEKQIQCGRRRVEVLFTIFQAVLTMGEFEHFVTSTSSGTVSNEFHLSLILNSKKSNKQNFYDFIQG